MEKRGQVFLIAAFIAISIIIGLVAITNTVNVSPERGQIYDLADEIEFETKRVIDYGVYREGDIEEDTEEVVRNFLINYSDYIAQDDIVFVYGDGEDLNALYFDSNANVGSVSICAGGGCTSQQIEGQDIQSIDVSSSNGVATVSFDDIDYHFDLREGENFYFVLSVNLENERFVAISEE